MKRLYNLFYVIFGLAATPLSSYGQCMTLPEPLFLQAPDSICAEKKDLIIKASRIKEAGAKYLWKTPSGEIIPTMDSILRIPNPTARHSGNYSVAIRIDTCQTAFFGPINVQVIGAPQASASTIKTIVSCNSPEISIASIYLTNASIFGEWTGSEGLVFESPKSPKTVVKGLKEGENIAIWTLSTKVCPFFLKDTFRIRREVKPVLETASIALRAGESSKTIHLGKVSGSNLDILKDTKIEITKHPKNGTLDTSFNDGKRLKYTRNANGFSGRDVFEIRVCNLKCDNLCSVPIPYTIDLKFDERYPNVGMRKVLAPQEQGNAGLFTIENIETYPKNTLQILNRWGSKIVEFPDYKNSGAWRGQDENGSLLAPGAYYFLLQTQDKDGSALRPYTGIFYIVHSN